MPLQLANYAAQVLRRLVVIQAGEDGDSDHQVVEDAAQVVEQVDHQGEHEAPIEERQLGGHQGAQTPVTAILLHHTTAVEAQRLGVDADLHVLKPAGRRVQL